MEFSAAYIANLVGGTVEGDSSLQISTLSGITEAKDGSLTFLSNTKYKNHLYDTHASAVLVNKDFTPDKSGYPTLIRVDNAYSAFTTLLTMLDGKLNGKRKLTQEVHHTAQVSADAHLEINVGIGAYTIVEKGCEIGANTLIYPHVYIGENVKIGKNCTLYSGVRIYSGCVLGDDVILHANVVIGSDGFGFAPNSDGTYNKIPQLGNVVVGDRVEIGAGTIVDRATLGTTRIGNGVKLDNLIQIAHNVEIGDHTVIAAQTGIAGSSKIGKYCVIGGQVGISGHLKIGDYVKIQAQSGITKNLKEGEVVQGSPAFEYNHWSRSYVIFKQLPKIIKEIEEKLKNIK